MEPYRSYFPHARLLLPETERLVERVLQLPTGTSIAGDGDRDDLRHRAAGLGGRPAVRQGLDRQAEEQPYESRVKNG